MRVSPRRLQGWEPAEVSFYERDGLGRVQTVVTLREPEFSLEDVALLLAMRAKDSLPRGPHGLLLSESTDPASEGQWEVPEPVLDFATAKLNAVQERYKKQYGDTVDLGSLYWQVRRRDASQQ